MKRKKLISFITIILFAVAVPLTSLAAPGGTPGPPPDTGPGEETSNNLSYPALYTAGTAGVFDWSVPTGAVLGVNYSYGCDRPETIDIFSYPNTSCVDEDGNALIPGACVLAGAPCEGFAVGDLQRIYWQKVSDNFWSADTALSNPSPTAMYLDWGDNLESNTWSDSAVIRVETQPFAYMAEEYPMSAFDVPVAGDWDGTGTAKTGMFRDGIWHLDYAGNDGVYDVTINFGMAGDVPVVGDWNGDGISDVGVVRKKIWFLDSDGTPGWNAGTDTILQFGLATDIRVSGDWDGNGTSDVGVFRNGWWYLDSDGTPGWNAGTDTSFKFGRLADVPVTGDWDGNGISDVGVFRNGWWYLDSDGTQGWNPGTDASVRFGIAGDIPVAADWDGDGAANAGVIRNGTWYLDYDGDGNWDVGIDRMIEGGMVEVLQRGIQMWHVSGHGPTELWGARTTDAAAALPYLYESPYAIIHTANARLNIAKLEAGGADCPSPGTGQVGTPPALALDWVVDTQNPGEMVWTSTDALPDPCKLADMDYTVELNVGGKYVYGYNWMLRNDSIEHCEGFLKAGWWRLTFYTENDEVLFDPLNPVIDTTAAPSYVAEPVVPLLTAEEETEDTLYTPVIDYGHNLTYIDICIDSK